MIKLDGIEKMGDGEILVRQSRPAEFVDERDAAGNLISTKQVMPAEYYVANPPARFPWLPVLAGGGLLFLLFRNPRGGKLRRHRGRR